ncbi:hypothetical protein QJS10_CPB04g01241 [Acorus calamus]|uniref:RRM domain-containing protein n=1 Tax=Acorus calamus TaxID=4465 RepID=A0AAV9F3H0_ACOCL|nr:hypothetical protein QJS10_CPB04g01241 [Acorus calamus]
MGAMDLSVQVLNIPSKTTQEDLITFFSYCGSVDEIQLKRSNNGNQTQEALVTFRQPYARQTALLLNDATISGNRVRVLPGEISETSPISNGSLKGKHGFIHSPQSVLKTIASKGYEAMNKAKELAVWGLTEN